MMDREATVNGLFAVQQYPGGKETPVVVHSRSIVEWNEMVLKDSRGNTVISREREILYQLLNFVSTCIITQLMLNLQVPYHPRFTTA